jgi:hypothetical protein
LRGRGSGGKAEEGVAVVMFGGDVARKEGDLAAAWGV